ncbi:MAG: tetratricopeptide repeat protein [Flavobacteriaceae bacterium]|nr:tetratricopeptide repeat protein [Flavobacteriaceae bacterium]
MIPRDIRKFFALILQKTGLFIKAPLKNNSGFSVLAFFSYLFFIVLVCSCKSEKKNEYSDLKKQHTSDASFVGGESCKSCHEEEFASWKDSHHDQSMKIADSLSVLGDFNDATFRHNNVSSTFFKKEGDFYVNTQGEDGLYTDYKIVYTFGFTPLQQYIVAFPNGEYNCLLTAWDTVEKKWFHLQPQLDIIHDEWINWSGGSQRWNTMCADCHSTNLHKNYNTETQEFTTTFDEINVSCEACHGPGSAHNAYYEKENPTGIPPQIHMPTGNIGKKVVDHCARCHSRRSQIANYYDYKGGFLDHYYPSLLEAPAYELDGQIKEEDYVYGSFVQSKMYGLGISCRDCHDVHSLKLKKEGNDLCMSCHTPNYNTPEHHFHKENTEASQCINCHMTGVIYMGNDFRRDHSFRIPRPDQSEKYNTPNACTGCHTDKTDKWASDFVIEKYGSERKDHFSDHLLKGYFEDKKEFKILFSNKTYPEIARATALKQFGNVVSSYEDVQEIAGFLNDTAVMVRVEAVNALERIATKEFTPQITAMLSDSIRSVRVFAARYLHASGVSLATLSEGNTVTQELEEYFAMNSDFASGMHQVAVYQQQQGAIDLAVKAYRRALEIDDRFNKSRMNLALLLYQEGQVEESEKLYLKVVDQEPNFGDSYYMLGLLYNEMGHGEKALKYLEKASVTRPLNRRAIYNYAIKLQEIGQYKASLENIERGLEGAPTDERLLYLKLVAQLKLKKNQDAVITCKILLRIAPNNSNYHQIMTNLTSPKR